MKLTVCELKTYIYEKSYFSAFQQGVCQISTSIQSRDIAKKAKMLDKMTYGISELMTSDGRTDRQTRWMHKQLYRPTYIVRTWANDY